MKNTKYKPANKFVYVEQWINYIVYPRQDIEAKLLDNGKWECEINLPVIEQTVRSVSKSEINALLNATSKAYKIIKECMADCGEEFTPFNVYGPNDKYIFYLDNVGRAKVSVKEECGKRYHANKLKKEQACAKAMEQALAKIKKANGSNDDLFIIVEKRSAFDENYSLEQIGHAISHAIYGESCWAISWQSISIVGDHVVAIGHSYIMD